MKSAVDAVGCEKSVDTYSDGSNSNAGDLLESTSADSCHRFFRTDLEILPDLKLKIVRAYDVYVCAITE